MTPMTRSAFIWTRVIVESLCLGCFDAVNAVLTSLFAYSRLGYTAGLEIERGHRWLLIELTRVCSTHCVGRLGADMPA